MLGGELVGGEVWLFTFFLSYSNSVFSPIFILIFIIIVAILVVLIRTAIILVIELSSRCRLLTTTSFLLRAFLRLLGLLFTAVLRELSLFLDPFSVIFLSEADLTMLILAQDRPILITHLDPKAIGVIDQIVEITRAVLANLHCYIVDFVAHRPSFDLFGHRVARSQKSFSHLANVNFEVTDSLNLFKLLNKVIKFLSDGQIVTPRVKSVDIDRVEPNQVL